MVQETYKGMMTDSFGDTKVSKEKELNASMSIDRQNQTPDEMTRAIQNATTKGSDE